MPVCLRTNAFNWSVNRSSSRIPSTNGTQGRDFLNLSEGKVLCIMETPSKKTLAAWFQKMKMPCVCISPVGLEGEMMPERTQGSQPLFLQSFACEGSITQAVAETPEVF